MHKCKVPGKRKTERTDCGLAAFESGQPANISTARDGCTTTNRKQLPNASPKHSAVAESGSQNFRQIECLTYSSFFSNGELSSRINELNVLLSKPRRTPIEHWRVVRTSKAQLKHAQISELIDDLDVRPHAIVKIKNVEVRGLLDSGASISCLGKGAIQTLHKFDLKWKEHSSCVQTASGQLQSVLGYADINIEFMNSVKRIRFYIVPSLKKPMYLGVDFWLAFNILPKFDEINIPEISKINDTPLDMHELDDCLPTIGRQSKTCKLIH